MADDVHSLTSQNNEFAMQQKTLANAMRKMERNLEDMSDNFHRTQSQMTKGQPQNNIDETVVTKIRGTVFDVQSQQSKFQNQLDVMAQDSTNKETKLDDLAEEIKILQVCFNIPYTLFIYGK